ncbi:MAG: NACHT domain-containing protein [Symploca sp. SIO2D2]|nr:NACHT domain-containing protein [Symploca sp. SIO2D2]
MSFSLTAQKIIVTSIAKSLLNGLDIDSALTNTTLQQTIDIFTSDELFKEASSPKIDKIVKQIGQDIKPLFEQEARNWEPGSKNAIVFSVAETLVKIRLTPEILAKIDLDGAKLKQYLLNANSEATRFFSRNEKALYQQAIAIVSHSLIEAAPQLEGFILSTTATTLKRTTIIIKRLEEIARQLKELREKSIQAADEFALRYRRIVQDKLDRLELFGLPRIDRLTNRQSLSMAYITLSVSGAGERTEDIAKSLLTLMGDEQWEREWKHRSRPIDEVIYKCRRLVIRGAAGAGKSTLLQWLAVRAASQSFPPALQDWNYKIPFFIRLRSLVGKEFPTPEQFPALIARNFAATMPTDWVHRYLNLGQVLVLIDGVDELPRQERLEFFEALKDLVRDFSQVTYIVTSRPSGLTNFQGEEWEEWEDWVEEEEFVNLTLEPMSKTNVEQFIERWHSALPSDETANNQSETPVQIAENLKQQLRQRRELRQLASTPLLCAMICALHRERRETLPSARLQLYRECIDMLLNRRDEGRKIKLDETYPTGLNEDQKIELLQSLALRLMRLNRSNLEAERVDKHFDTELANTSLPATVTGKQIRALFVDRAGLLREPVVGQIDFAHRTFQEYLAAKAALDDDSLEELLQKVTDDQWRESIIVAAGLARPKERVQLLSFLIEQGNREAKAKNYLYLLAVACLETATTVEPKTRNKVLTCAERLLPPHNEEEVTMVARAGNEIVPLLEYKPHYSAYEACKCIAALVQIGTHKAMQTLVGYTKAAFESKYDQYSIGRAIGRGWDIFEQSAYLSQVLSNLQILDLGGTQISDVTPLSELTQLQVLRLSETQVTDVSSLSRLTQLQVLRLSETQVTNFFPLSGLTQLQVLHLSGTQITDISPLSGLTQLQVLHLSRTQITDVSPLSGLTQLQVLHLSRTQIKNVFPLSGLTQLKVLFLNKTQVTDVSPLEHLPSLIIYTNDDDKIEQWRSIGMNVEQDSEFMWQPRYTL